MNMMRTDEARHFSISFRSAIHLVTRAAAAAFLLFTAQAVQAQELQPAPVPRPNLIQPVAPRANVLPALPAGVAAERALPGFIDERPPQGNVQMLTCSTNRPHQIQRFAVSCRSQALDVSISDCCIPGDHWEARVQSRDEKPVTAMTTAPGPANLFGAPARVYRFAGTPFNPNLDALIECRYIHGIHVFPAAATLRLTSSGPCTVQNLGITEEIKQTP